MSKTKTPIEAGACPKCGHKFLEYRNSRVEVNLYIHNVECRNCDFIGMEIHSIQFCGYRDLDGTGYGSLYELPEKHNFNEGSNPR